VILTLFANRQQTYLLSFRIGSLPLIYIAVRQVPDNQEVYQDCSEETGAVLVIEILEYQTNVENNDACNFFLKDLGDANETPPEEQVIHSNQVINLLGNACEMNKERILPSLALPPSTTLTSQLHACISRGTQKVKQKGSITSQCIDIELCALRLKDIDTDLLITLSIPRRNSGSDSDGGSNVGEEIFKQILASFNIKDYSLFGG